MGTASDRDLLQQTHDAVVRIETTCGGCTRRLLDLESAVYGNGQPGLRSDVAVAQSDIAGLKDEISKVRGLFWKVGGLAATVAGVIAGAIQAAAAWFR